MILADTYLNDKGKWISYLEVRDYENYSEEEQEEGMYDSIDDIPIWYAAYDGNKLAWVKIKEKDFKDYEGLRIFFVNGSLNKGGYEEIEVVPVAVVNEMMYLEPIW